MPSPELGPRGGKYPHHIVQSILVPKDRQDVRGDPDRARAVAERYGARPGGKIAEQENFFAFRQVNPDKIQDGTYVSFKVPFSGVVLRKGLPIGAPREYTRSNPPEEPGIGTFLAFGAVVAVGLGILATRAQAATAPDPNHPIPTTPPPPTVRRPTAPAPTFVRQEDGFDPGSAAATRVLQTQLRALGYHVPAIDGVFGHDTTLAVQAFLDANQMSFDRTPARDIFQTIDSQYAYFFDTRGGLRSI